MRKSRETEKSLGRLRGSPASDRKQIKDYDRIMARLNAEIEHYRQILARKGSSGGDEPEPEPEPTPTPDPEPEPEP